MNLQTQWATLLWMLASGGILGIAFDSYRVVSGQLRFPRWSVHFLDVCYWVGSSLFVFRMLYHVNQGELRFYVFLGLFLGVWIHFLLLSVLIQRFVVNLIKIAHKIYETAIRIFQLLVITPMMWLYKLLRVLLGFIWIVVLFLGRVLLSPIWKLLIWCLRPIWRASRIPDMLQTVRRIMIQIWNRWRGKQ